VNDRGPALPSTYATSKVAMPSSVMSRASISTEEGHWEQALDQDYSMTYLEGERSHGHAGSVRRFNIDRVIVLNKPPATERPLSLRTGLSADVLAGSMPVTRAMLPSKRASMAPPACLCSSRSRPMSWYCTPPDRACHSFPLCSTSAPLRDTSSGVQLEPKRATVERPCRPPTCPRRLRYCPSCSGTC